MNIRVLPWGRTAAVGALAACIALPALALTAAAPAAQPGPGYALVPLHTVESVNRDCADVLERGKRDVARLEKTAPAQLLAQWNRFQIAVQDVEGPIYLLSEVHPEKAVRDAAQACEVKISAFTTEVSQNSRLYARFKSMTPHGAVQVELRKDILLDFEDAGVSLPEEKRARAKAILNKLDELSTRFSQNVRDDPTTVVMTPQEMEGMPADYVAAQKKNAEGNYVLRLDYPSYFPFMENAVSEPARKRYYMAKLNEGGQKNIEILDEVVGLRKELAGLFGYSSYADFSLRRKMAGSRERVEKFLAEVKSTVTDLEKRDVEELRRAKAEDLRQPLEGTQINRWDVSYYQQRIKKARFDVNQEALRKYFPTEASVAYALKVAETLYGIEFRKRDVPVWHPDVRFYEVFDRDSGRRIASIYLDLFPREGKYGHAAAFPIFSGSRLAHRTPLTALVTNFNRQGLTQDELETLLHEFGHVMHGSLTVAQYVNQAGTSVKRDFVEAPSQMFEEWARREEPLRLFAQVCPDCPRLSSEQIAQLQAARNFGRGLFYARQWLYAAYDIALYSDRPGEALATWERMEGATPLGHPPGTMFPASFSHIVSGYAAGYYGYMWSEVIALDMLSAFGQDMLDPRTGRKYRQTILAPGGQVPPDRLVHNFLGREPSPKAFFKEITGAR